MCFTTCRMRKITFCWSVDYLRNKQLATADTSAPIALMFQVSWQSNSLKSSLLPKRSTREPFRVYARLEFCRQYDWPMRNRSSSHITFITLFSNRCQAFPMPCKRAAASCANMLCQNHFADPNPHVLTSLHPILVSSTEPRWHCSTNHYIYTIVVVQLLKQQQTEP